LVHDLLARQMIGQWLALGLRPFTDGRCGFGGIGFCFGNRRGFGLAGFQFLKPQFELLDLSRDPFRRAASWSFSFSISSALYCTESSATFSSLWQASAKARSETISAGSSAVASDMPKLYSAIF
jgi:hypothetical protein